jgi:hypothetical protein
MVAVDDWFIALFLAREGRGWVVVFGWLGGELRLLVVL